MVFAATSRQDSSSCNPRPTLDCVVDGRGVEGAESEARALLVLGVEGTFAGVGGDELVDDEDPDEEELVELVEVEDPVISPATVLGACDAGSGSGRGEVGAYVRLYGSSSGIGGILPSAESPIKVSPSAGVGDSGSKSSLGPGSSLAST